MPSRARNDPWGGRIRDAALAAYNTTANLIERSLAAGRGAKPAFVDDRGHYHLCQARRAGEPVR
jgi:hypothetical protein